MTIWFPRFIRWVYKVHGVIPTNLWAVLNKKTGEMEAPNPPCPVWDETIINPKMFTGMNKAYPHGNIQMRLKKLVTFIMVKMKLDPNDSKENNLELNNSSNQKLNLSTTVKNIENNKLEDTEDVDHLLDIKDELKNDTS